MGRQLVVELLDAQYRGHLEADTLQDRAGVPHLAQQRADHVGVVGVEEEIEIGGGWRAQGRQEVVDGLATQEPNHQPTQRATPQCHRLLVPSGDLCKAVVPGQVCEALDVVDECHGASHQYTARRVPSCTMQMRTPPGQQPLLENARFLNLDLVLEDLDDLFAPYQDPEVAQPGTCGRTANTTAVAAGSPCCATLRPTMKQSGTCPKCGKHEIVADAKAVDRGDGDWERELIVATFGKPNALFFKDKRVTTVSAWVYADEPRAIKLPRT